MVVHLNATNLPRTQSAYRSLHSKETVLLKVFSDIGTATDSGHLTAKCFLNVLAAFDTVDHEILLDRLEKTYGFIGLTIKWLRTHLVRISCTAQRRALIIDKTHRMSTSRIGTGEATNYDIHSTT